MSIKLEAIIILIILFLAQVQAYWIISDFFPYPKADIASPYIEMTKGLVGG